MRHSPRINGNSQRVSHECSQGINDDDNNNDNDSNNRKKVEVSLLPLEKHGFHQEV